MSAESPVLESGLNQVETLIRVGRAAEAREKLRHLDSRGWTREDLPRAAGLFRRCGSPEISVRLLHSLVRVRIRDGHPAETDSTESERAEYAVALAYLGAEVEAMGLLHELDRGKLLEAKLYLAFIQMSRWEYRSAIPLLEKFLAAPGDEYRQLVARVNLASALVWEHKDARAAELLRRASDQCRQHGARRLEANCREFSAQLAIQQRRFGAAREQLEQAVRLLKLEGGREALYVRKWGAILDLHRRSRSSPEARQGARALAELRGEALRLGNWETARECDIWVALAGVDPELVVKLYYGSPYPALRQRLLEENQLNVSEIRSAYDWELGSVPATIQETESPWNTSGAKGVLGTFRALATDFYRPLRVSTLHAQIFPDEPYHPRQTPHRIAECMRKTRDWLQATGSRLSIDWESGGYRFVSSGPCALHILRPDLGADWQGNRAQDPLRELRREFEEREFSIAEAARVLGLSIFEAQQVLAADYPRAGLVRIGEGRFNRYRFLRAAHATGRRRPA